MRFSAIVCTILAVSLAGPALAAPAWIWDTDRDGVDDRIVAVETGGLPAAYENGDLNARLRFDVDLTQGLLTYGIYVKYAVLPTAADAQALQGLGLPTHVYRYIPYIRTRATHAQIQSILGLSGVLRVETIPMMYAANDVGTQTMQASHSDFVRFPTATRDLGMTGKGVVIAILDSGVNDAPDVGTGYPGHESLRGKFLGGGEFFSGDPNVNTGLTESINPVDRGPLVHGTHVAGTAMGSGGPEGISADGEFGQYRGVAPDARLVDCKVLSDAGAGFGSADGLEWCIFNKNNTWGLTGPDAIYSGIQAANLSLGGLDESDGTDAGSAAVNAATRAGIACSVASGNDGNTGFISSPAAADDAITVGATQDNNTLDRDDDVIAGFSNEGPRDADPDGDQLDEYKPNVCAPGSGIVSANGDLSTNGDQYVPNSGTSMATPMTSGVVALIVQACPGIAPLDIRRILQETADHRTTGGKQPPGAADPFGIDPNYHPSWGWGNVHAYAAVLEGRYPTRTQVIREWAEEVPGGIDVRWTTQREVNLQGFNVLRADPLYGQIGPFQQLNANLILGVGDEILAKDDNRTDYLYPDQSTLVDGATYWYKIQWVDSSGNLKDEPAFPVCIGVGTPLATIQWSITHNAVDNDLSILVGNGVDASNPSQTAEFFFVSSGTGGRDSSRTVPGEATTGNIQHFWSRVLTSKDVGAAQSLPPSTASPWFLSVQEGGFINRTGRVEDFRITVHDTGGDVVYLPSAPLPVATVETQTTLVWIPSDPALEANHAPVLDAIGAKEVPEGGNLVFTVTGHDPDGDSPLTFSASGLPAGASFDAGLQEFTWAPDHSTVAVTTVFTATLRIEDPLGAFDEEEIEITVHDTDPNQNLAPYWQAMNDQSVVNGNTLGFKVAATDPENQPLTYSASNLPGTATFDPNTRCFEWTTTEDDVGEYTVTFSVSDGVNATVLETVCITVKGGVPTAIGDCESEFSVYLGTSGIGSDDAGTADVDTVNFSCPRRVNRLIATLGWTLVSSDIDYRLFDSSGNVIGSGASLANPEVILIDNLDAGDYYFVITGYLVAADTDWTLDVEKCLLVPVEVALSHFVAHPGTGDVRLEWATSLAVNHKGFHVYRSSDRNAGYERITTHLLTGDGVYQFTDPDPLAVSGDVAYYKLRGVADDGSFQEFGPYEVQLAGVRPLRFGLSANAPNPFGGAGTRIRFQLPMDTPARIDIYNVRGALVRTLVNGPFQRGHRTLFWDGADASGHPAASGVYFFRLEVPGRYVETRRMMLVR